MSAPTFVLTSSATASFLRTLTSRSGEGLKLILPLRLHALSLSRPLRSLHCLHGETGWSCFTLEAFSKPSMVYLLEHVSMNSQKKKITCNLFSYPLVRNFSPVQRVQTRNQPVTRSTHTDQPIDLFFQLFRQPISRLTLFVSHEGACNGNGGLLQAHILSLSPAT